MPTRQTVSDNVLLYNINCMYYLL